MALITTIEEVRANGVKVRFINSQSSIADMDLAGQMFLVPVLGQAMYDALQSEYDTPGDILLGALLQRAQRALAPLAFWLDLPNIQSQISESGVVTVVSDNQQAAHRWEFEQIRESLSRKGCFALEIMMAFAYDNATILAWTPPSPIVCIFKTGVEFCRYFPVYQAYRCFESLRPIIKQVEDQYIRNSIGSDYFDTLRDKASPTTQEAAVLEYIKKAVANLTIKTAIEALSVKVGYYGFTVALQGNADLVQQGEQNAPDNQLSLMLASTERTGINYIREMKKYMDAVASSSVLAYYYSSIYYTSPEDRAAQVDPNSTRTGIFSM